MKKLLILISVMLLLSSVTYAQTLATTTTQPSVGPVEIPINVTGIGTMYTLTVYYSYDDNVLTYTGITNAADPNIDVSFPTPGVIKFLVGAALPATTTIPDGKLLDIQFTYNGGYSDLSFGITGSHRSSLLPTTFVTYYFSSGSVTNGAVQGYYDNIIDGGDWNTAGNWSASKVADAWANVTVASGTETTIDAAAMANNLTIAQGGQLTSNSDLNVAGDFLIESDASGSGSFINNGTLSGTTDVEVENYLTTGQYHGISMPVAGQTARVFENISGNVYLKKYNEIGNDYTNILSYDDPLDVMHGYFIKIESGAPYTASYTGALNASGSFITTKDGEGYNFVGNPFTSAIDWEAVSGWGGSGVDDNIWVYNGSSFDVYNKGTHSGDAGQYIAMNQGFFVQASSAGSLTMSNEVCVHNTVSFQKNQAADQDVIKLSLTSNDMIDNTYIVLKEGATVDYEGTFDAHKLFGFDADYPQIYSTANDFMAINSLPIDYREAIPMDVRGANGNTMTIAATETAGFEELYLQDNASGAVVNLIDETYTFSYNADVTDRFTLFFSVTDVEENTLNNNATVFAYDNTIQVVLSGIESADVTVFNLLGQAVDSRTTNGSITRIPVQQSGYYLVKVSNGTQVSTQKVFIK